MSNKRLQTTDTPDDNVDHISYRQAHSSSMDKLFIDLGLREGPPAPYSSPEITEVNPDQDYWDGYKATMNTDVKKGK